MTKTAFKFIYQEFSKDGRLIKEELIARWYDIDNPVFPINYANGYIESMLTYRKNLYLEPPCMKNIDGYHWDIIMHDGTHRVLNRWCVVDENGEIVKIK